MSLDITDLELLIILQEKPMANDSTLARLTNLSSPTVKRRIDRLYEVKAIERIQALIDYQKIDLIIVSVFLQISYEKLETATNFLNKHPYIYYHVRSFGNINGIHATYRIPSNGYSLLEKYFTKLQSMDLILSFKLVNHGNSNEHRTKPRFIVYNSSENKWDFSFLKWVDIPPERLFRGIDQEELNHPTEIPGLEELDAIDVEILSILSLNSRIKNVDILENLSSEISPQRLSDRLRYLKKYFINNYRVYLNWDEIFNFQGCVFVCYCNEEAKKYFKTLLKYRPPPFETTFREFESGFTLYVICPIKHMLEIMTTLDSKVEKFDIFILDYKSSKRFQLNSSSFNAENKYWRFDEEYLLNVSLFTE
jgi:DNA-binding Lrp family transcriptional regulator